jgi:hypothetical protein
MHRYIAEQSATTMVKFVLPEDRMTVYTKVCVSQDIKFSLGKFQVIVICMKECKNYLVCKSV